MMMMIGQGVETHRSACAHLDRRLRFSWPGFLVGCPGLPVLGPRSVRFQAQCSDLPLPVSLVDVRVETTLTSDGSDRHLNEEFLKQAAVNHLLRMGARTPQPQHSQSCHGLRQEAAKQEDALCPWFMSRPLPTNEWGDESGRNFYCHSTKRPAT